MNHICTWGDEKEMNNEKEMYKEKVHFKLPLIYLN